MIIRLPLWLLPALASLLCLIGLACVVYWDDISRFVTAYEGQIKVVSLVLGPIATIASIYWGFKSKRDLVDQSNIQVTEFSKRATELAQEMRVQSEALGALRVQAEHAQHVAAQREREVNEARHEIEVRGKEVERLRQNLHSITEGAQDLWKLRPPQAFAEYRNWLRDPAGAKLITFGNLKGGVGKTTLAANFAAYLSHTRKRPVLLIDLDYQGSLSNMLMLAIQKEEVESRVDRLFDEGANIITVDRAAEQLVPKLAQGWLVPANYTFAQLENRLLLQWLLQEDGGLDVRFRLAHTLLRPEVRQRYSAIVFDMPPRMTLGSINALVASHYFVVPTVLDTLSAEAVGQFLTNMRAIKGDLDLDIELAGVAGVMTRQEGPTGREVRALELLREGVAAWSDRPNLLFEATLPRKVDIANAAGEDFAYFQEDAKGPLTRFFDPLFEEICQAVWRGDGP